MVWSTLLTMKNGEIACVFGRVMTMDPLLWINRRISAATTHRGSSGSQSADQKNMLLAIASLTACPARHAQLQLARTLRSHSPAVRQGEFGWKWNPAVVRERS